LTDEEVDAGSERLEDLLPDTLHEQVETLRQDIEWVDPTEFR
jgi:hypothetical protein